MFPTVPSYNLKKLHLLVKEQMPKVRNGLFETYKEIIPAILKQAKDPNYTLEDHWQVVGNNVPLGRIGEAEEVGDVMCFLASSKASYITGTAINVDGGSSPVV